MRGRSRGFATLIGLEAIQVAPNTFNDGPARLLVFVQGAKECVERPGGCGSTQMALDPGALIINRSRGIASSLVRYLETAVFSWDTTAGWNNRPLENLVEHAAAEQR